VRDSPLAQEIILHNLFLPCLWAPHCDCSRTARHRIGKKKNLQHPYETNNQRSSQSRDDAQPPRGEEMTAMILMIWTVMGYWDGDGRSGVGSGMDGLKYTYLRYVPSKSTTLGSSRNNRPNTHSPLFKSNKQSLIQLHSPPS
jgi:hypothetical protein